MEDRLMIDGTADALQPASQQQVKQEPASPVVELPHLDSPRAFNEVQSVATPSSASPAPAPKSARYSSTSQEGSRPSAGASQRPPSPRRPSHRSPAASSRLRVRIVGVPKGVPLGDVCKRVWTGTSTNLSAHFTTSSKPDAQDAIVELRNDDEVQFVLRRLNGIFIRNCRIGVEALPSASAEAPPTDRSPPEESSRRRSLSPRRKSSPPPTRRDRSPYSQNCAPLPLYPSLTARQTSPRHPRRAIWLEVHNLPRSVGERGLYDALAPVAVPEDIYVFHAVRQPDRSAFIAFHDTKTANDAVDQLASHRFDRQRVAVDWFSPTHGERDPLERLKAGLRLPYAGPPRNMGAILDLSYRLLLVSGIAPHARERDLRDSIDLVVGRGSVKALRISIGAGSDRNRTATIEMDRHSDASRVLDRVDGALFEGQALTVNWVHTSSTGERAAGVDDKIGLARSSRSPARRRPSPENSPPVPPAPTSHALPPASPSQPPPSPMQKKVLLAANGGAVHAAKNLSRSKGLDALRYLGLPQPDLDAISHMWAPLDEAPPNKNDKAFDRHLRTKVKFGFVPQQDAEASLQDERMRTAFKDDPVLQHRFEVFLAAQAGRSKEWYLTFFAHIAEFNRLSRLFSETARRRWHSA